MRLPHRLQSALGCLSTLGITSVWCANLDALPIAEIASVDAKCNRRTGGFCHGEPFESCSLLHAQLELRGPSAGLIYSSALPWRSAPEGAPKPSGAKRARLVGPDTEREATRIRSLMVRRTP